MAEWYSLVEGEELRQGEILIGVPIYVPETHDIPLEGEQIPAKLRRIDGVIVTPSCDLVERDKGPQKEWVVLCEHWDLNKQLEAGRIKKEWVKEIEKGRHSLYYILPASPFPKLAMGMRIVNFGRVYSLPIGFVRKYAANSLRVRLESPFCQHFAQAFATCFMRVGLPIQATAYSRVEPEPGP